MKKVYLSELTSEQVTERLNRGEIVHSEVFPVVEYKLINGIICRTDRRGITYNASFDISQSNRTHYFEEPEPLEIEVGKFYKTRDGSKVVCYVICGNDTAEYPCKFAIIGEYQTFRTTKTGKIFADVEHKYDIIEEWKE